MKLLVHQLDGNWLVPYLLTLSSVLAVPIPGKPYWLPLVVTRDYSLLFQIKLPLPLVRLSVLLENSPVKLESGPLVPLLLLR
jgi:hypothetical protein